MLDDYSLNPKEAAFIAANAYFTLAGWEKRYRFNMNSSARVAPQVSRGQASNSVVNRNVVGTGPRSVAKAGIGGGSVAKTIGGSTGRDLCTIAS